MQAVKAKITTHGINTFKEMGIELEEASRKLSVGQPVKVDLRRSHDKYAYEYPRNQNTRDSFPDKSASLSAPLGVIDCRPRYHKEERHHPVSEEFNVNG